MKKKSVFEIGMGSRKGYVSKFQEDESKTETKKNNKPTHKDLIFNKRDRKSVV